MVKDMEIGSNVNVQYRTKTKRWTMSVMMLSVIVSLGLMVALIVVVVKNKDSDDKPGKEICLTEGCTQAASRVLAAVDKSVKPCDDFYSFACGAWMKTNVIPDGKTSKDIWGILRDAVEVTNKYLLEDPVTDPNATAIQKAKDMYASCVNMELINDKGISPAIPLLDELGGWPVLGNKSGGNWNETNFDITDVMITLRKYNNKVIVDMGVGIDDKNSTQRIINFDQEDVGLPARDWYLVPNYGFLRDAYVTLARDIAIAFGAEPDVAEKDMNDMLKLEIQLANISMTEADKRDTDKTYNKMTIADLSSHFPEPKPADPIQFKWLEYAQGIFHIDGVDIVIEETEPVLVRDMGYYKQLFGVLQSFPKRTIANYLVWRIMQNRARNLGERFQEIITTYNKVVGWSAVENWRKCMSYVIQQMSAAVGKLFVQEAFDEDSKEVALDMIHGIRNAFSEILIEKTWMDDATKQLAQEKADAVQEWIGYADDILDDSVLNEIYENVTVDRNEYFQNVLGNLQRWGNGDLQVLREEYNKNGWGEPPTDVNAQYSPIQNNIQFPAGIFQPPFYKKDQPRSMNYGGIGVIIGHELTHGFDDQGRRYDKEGNLKDWWGQTVINNFVNRAQCIVDQYGNFRVQELNMTVNGRLTLGENIADNGGLKESFRAYRNWVESQGHEEPTLPGVEFSNNELFFINFAQNWCSNESPDSLRNSLQTDPHSPGQYRVIGTLQNSQDFANTFNCPAGSYMNPTKKCSVWKK